MVFGPEKLLRPASRTGIQSKLGRVLVLQMLFISVTTVLGVYAAALVVEKVMIGTALQNEAQHYWQALAKNPQHPLPNTDNLRGYSRNAVAAVDRIPADLAATPLGQSRASFEGRHPIVYLEERAEQQLLLVFDEQSVSKLSFWFGVVPLSLTLLVIYLSAWFVYRQSSKTLSPLMSLAQAMRDFNLETDRLESLQFEAWSGPKVDDEVRVLAESLSDFTEQLKAQLARERAFSRDVSHELRTPLAVIRGSLELLVKQGNLNEQQSRVVDRMQVTSRDMQSLIEVLLLLAQVQHDDEKNNELSEVNALLPLLISQIEISHNSDQHVQIVLDQQADLQVHVPAQAVGMVLANLLRNACNYTLDGDVTVVVYKHGVRVRDTGAGMRAEDLQRLQQPFQRDSNNNTGYGLGLDIVRRLCERYGWTVNIDSSRGQGTVVDVRMLE